jgi:exosortase
MENTLKAIDKKERNIVMIKLALAAVFFLLMFYPTYGHLAGRFNAVDSYYSHGILIPFLCIWLVFRKRKKLALIKVKPAMSGFFIILCGVLLHLGGVALKVNFASYMAIVIVLSGIVLYLLGKEFFMQLLFPIAFLFFMLPLPAVVIIGIAFHMKMMAANLATMIVNVLGVPAVKDGSTIFLKNGYLIIGDPCSGLRSLISFFALGALFTQITDAHYIKRIALVIATAPIALFSNVLRIVVLVLVTHIYGEEAAMGFIHDFTGVMVFVLGFAGFIVASKILRCRLTI